MHWGRSEPLTGVAWLIRSRERDDPWSMDDATRTARSGGAPERPTRRLGEMPSRLFRAVSGLIRGSRVPPSGVREVTVLFVDIRGYTEICGRRSLNEVYELVNGYADRVCRVIRSHGGTVVEFAGDGMMATFGADCSLESKECAAVRAALAMPGALDGLDETRISVGVGIATGDAFVGRICSAGLYTWSALGCTTNRASRLQRLTRDLGASIAVDATTWNALPAPPDGFSTQTALLDGIPEPTVVHTLEDRDLATPRQRGAA